MPSSATTITNATTILSSPKEDQHHLTDLIVPSPFDHSPIELPPILNHYDSVGNRPPSPDSPKLLHMKYIENHPPSFLEPNPQVYMYNPSFSFDLFKPRPSRIHVNKLHHHHHQQQQHYQQQQHHTTIIQKPTTRRPENKKKKRKPSIEVDQSMFLTKNAHIKRPRNAWIHFRCYYGQALKSQDPTLRAEEISKRASERWGKLTENEKKPWHGLAEQEKLAHREAFPEYRYCPRRSTNRQRSTSTE